MGQAQQVRFESVDLVFVAQPNSRHKKETSVWWVPIILFLCLWMAFQNNALSERVDQEIRTQTFSSP